MYCDKGNNLFRIIQEARKEYKKHDLPVATTPLDIDTPQGNHMTDEWRERHRILDEKVGIAVSAFEKHVSNCGICPK